jgi:hypothetical protein
VVVGGLRTSWSFAIAPSHGESPQVKEGTSHSGRIPKSPNGHTHERWIPEPDQLGGPSYNVNLPARVALEKASDGPQDVAGG